MPDPLDCGFAVGISAAGFHQGKFVLSPAQARAVQELKSSRTFPEIGSIPDMLLGLLVNSPFSGEMLLDGVPRLPLEVLVL